MQEQEEEEDRKRNEEFEKNNAEWCSQYLSDIEARDKATAKKKQTATSSKLRGNKLFKARYCQLQCHFIASLLHGSLSLLHDNRDEENSYLYFMPCTALHLSRRFEEALQQYMEALALTPYDGTAIVTNIAQAHIKLGQFEDALEFLERAVTIDPRNVKVPPGLRVGACVVETDPDSHYPCAVLRHSLAKPLFSPSVCLVGWRKLCSGRRRLTIWTHSTSTRKSQSSSMN